MRNPGYGGFIAIAARRCIRRSGVVGFRQIRFTVTPQRPSRAFRGIDDKCVIVLHAYIIHPASRQFHNQLAPAVDQRNNRAIAAFQYANPHWPGMDAISTDLRARLTLPFRALTISLRWASILTWYSFHRGETTALLDRHSSLIPIEDGGRRAFASRSVSRDCRALAFSIVVHGLWSVGSILLSPSSMFALLANHCFRHAPLRDDLHVCLSQRLDNAVRLPFPGLTAGTRNRHRAQSGRCIRRAKCR